MVMNTSNKLRIGDISDNGQVTVIDEDRLCYLVKSESRGSVGLRTISKSLLDEYISYFEKNPEANANTARDELSGRSDIDKFEYGYTSTLTVMAKMAIEGAENVPIGNSAKHVSDMPLQQIYYGAPGTGKSHCIKDNAKVKEAETKNLVFRTTFHPDSDYSTFVGAYKPTMRPVADKYKAVAGKDEEITYSFVPQAFLQAYVAAWNNQDENVFLVIEEINRGNCAQIFGDLFQLLDRDDNGCSEYPIMADKDLAKYLNGKDETGNEVLTNKDGIKDGKLCLPSNLHIWATMNTSDQSLFPIDSAFKRRWEWKYMPIEDAGKGWQIVVNGHEYDWYRFLEAINKEVLDLTHSEDKQLGYFFAKAKDNKIDATTLVNKVYFYLWTDVFKDYDFESQKAFRKAGSNEAIAFKDFFKAGEVDEVMAEQVLINLELYKPQEPTE